MRAANGTTRQVGSVENYFIRNVTGDFGMNGIIGSTAGVVWAGHGLFYENGTNPSIAKYTQTEVGFCSKDL